MLKNYLALTKPGIVFGNAITLIAGFILASQKNFSFPLFLATLTGLCAIVAAGCVLNNYFDRFSDQKMSRTKARPLARGAISLQSAIWFGWALFAFGVTTLALFTTPLATFVAILGFVVYVGFYTFWKYKTVYGTEIGSFAGATPPVVGYVAVTGQWDLAASLLFAIVALWQMPHFFAIAIYRQEEYASASIPVLPIKKGMAITKRQMLLYMCAFVLACVSLTWYGYTGYFYLITVSILGIYWLSVWMQGLKAESDKRWARKVFLSSLLVILGLCGSLSLDALSK